MAQNEVSMYHTARKRTHQSKHVPYLFMPLSMGGFLTDLVDWYRSDVVQSQGVLEVCGAKLRP